MVDPQDPFGLNVRPPLEMQFVMPDRQKMICLEAIEDVPAPTYCVHGRTKCFGCERWCHLGVETLKVVSAGIATPYCMRCSKEMAQAARDAGFEYGLPISHHDDEGSSHR